MPFGGHREYTDAREDVRQRVNAAIRDGSVFDAVVDFDEAVRDGYDPGGSGRATTPATACTPATRGTRAWRRRSTWTR